MNPNETIINVSRDFFSVEFDVPLGEMADGCISVVLWRSTEKQLQPSPITRIDRSGTSEIDMSIPMVIFRGRVRREGEA